MFKVKKARAFINAKKLETHTRARTEIFMIAVSFDDHLHYSVVKTVF